MTVLRRVYPLALATAVLALPALLAPPSLAGQEPKPAREGLSEASRQWLDEAVPYIITRAEREVFLSLPNEAERGRFIESFWRKRDPDPATTVNEYKEQYYKRIALANKLFGAEGFAGWRTERGRFFILLGPPHEVQRDFNVADDRGFNTVDKETWQYWGLPNPRLPYNLELVFVDRMGNGRFVLDWRPMSAKGAREADFTDMTFQFDSMEILAEAQRNPFEGLDRMKTVVTTQVTYDLVPFEYRAYSFKGEEGLAFVPVVVDIPYADLPTKPVAGKEQYSLNILVQVSDALGRVVAQKSREVSFALEPGRKDSLKGDEIQVQTSLDLEPGAYGLHFVVWDNVSGKAGTRHGTLTVPAFTPGQAALSDIILTAGDGEAGSAAGPRAAAMARRTFRNGEEMEVTLEVYGLAVAGEPATSALKADFEFLKGGRTVLKAPTLEPAPAAKADVRVSNTFRLKGFAPGDYALRITVVDTRTGGTLVKETAFTVAE